MWRAYLGIPVPRKFFSKETLVMLLKKDNNIKRYSRPKNQVTFGPVFGPFGPLTGFGPIT